MSKTTDEHTQALMEMEHKRWIDGSKVLSGFLPPSLSNTMNKIEPYGLFIVLGLVYFGVLSTIMSPILSFFLQTLL